MAKGSIGACKTSEKVLNIDSQKLSSFEQNQNICKRVAGVCLHRSQMGSMLGVNFDSLTRPMKAMQNLELDNCVS